MEASPHFSHATQRLSRRTDDRRKTITEAFSNLISFKLMIWGAGRISADETAILGGLPSDKVTSHLAQHLFCCLEKELRKAASGLPASENFMQDLFASIASEQILYGKKYRLFSNGREMTRATSLLLACTMNRIFVDTHRYQPLRTAKVYKSIADIIYDKGSHFIYFTTGMKENHPAYPDEMRVFCRKVLGHNALSMPHVAESVDHHIEKRLPRPIQPYYPANDISPR